jgi:hypothetical protein
VLVISVVRDIEAILSIEGCDLILGVTFSICEFILERIDSVLSGHSGSLCFGELSINGSGRCFGGC